MYCLEQQDNGPALSALWIDPAAQLQESAAEDLPAGAIRVRSQGWRMQGSGELYATQPPAWEQTTLEFVPYCFWGNREPGEMAVWVKYSQTR